MAISTQINNDLYKRALGEAEKERLAKIAQTQGAGAVSSAYLQAMNQAQSAIAAKTAGATTPSAAATAAPKTSGAFSETEIPAKTPAVQQQDYLIFGKQDPNFKVGMTDEDKASWNAIGAKYAAGDTSWNRDTDNFRKDGNWSSYYDDNGNINGWLYAADGTGGYAPVFGGRVGETGYAPGTVFYSPDGAAYTMGTDGSLTKSGNVTLAQYGSYVGPKAGYQDSDFWALNDAGQYQRYTNQTAPAEVLEAQGYYRDQNGLVMPMSDQQRAMNALQSAPEVERNAYQTAIEQAQENAKNAVATGTAPAVQQTTPQTVTPGVSSSGSASRSSVTRETTPTAVTPTVTPQQTQPAQQAAQAVNIQAAASQSAGNPYQAYMDQWSYEAAPEWTGGQDETYKEVNDYNYGQAPEWEGTEYQAKRDAALEAAGEKWQGSEYQPLRDAALKRAEQMQWNYDPNTDPVWQAYQKQYRREGDRATKEALAQASMRTGGLANSYAVTAASQAGDYYASQLSDKQPQLYTDAYNRYLQEFQRQLGISDQYQGFDDREYSRWADQQGRNFDVADRYNQYGEQDYDKYRDRLSQFNTDRNFQYGVNRDKVSDAERANQTAYNRYLDSLDQYNRDRAMSYEQFRDAVGDYRYDDETQYNRNYQAQRDAINDARYDLEWAQQLREYADAQGWKQKDWDQYLREYGDKLSEQEREWAYQMSRDAVSDARYNQEYADSRADTAYSRALADEERAYNRAWNEDERDYERGWDTTKWNQALREYDDEQAQQAWNNEYKLNSKSSTGSSGGGRSTGGTTASAETTTPSSGQYDESGRRAGTWQDSDGYTYSGYHADGQPKSAQYDSVRSKAKQSAGQGKAAVTRQLLAEVDARRITEYEAFMILEELGFRNGADRTGTSTGRNFIGPTNVQMVQ